MKRLLVLTVAAVAAFTWPSTASAHNECSGNRYMGNGYWQSCVQYMHINCYIFWCTSHFEGHWGSWYSRW